MSKTHRRLRLWTALSGLLLATRVEAMIYRPPAGRFKDGFILRHAGQFYLFSMIRKNMFEFYLDDLLVQTFNTTHEPGGIGLTPRRIGCFVVQNGLGLLENVSAWAMTLDK